MYSLLAYSIGLSVVAGFIGYSENTSLWCFGPISVYILYFFIDTKNEMIVNLVFKLLCLIKEDDEFDAAPLYNMARKRYSITFLSDEVIEAKENENFVKDLRSQTDYFTNRFIKPRGSIREGLDEEKVENTINNAISKKKLRIYVNFFRLVLITRYAIKSYVHKSKIGRDTQLRDKIRYLGIERRSNSSSSSHSEHESDSEDEFLKKEEVMNSFSPDLLHPRKMKTIGRSALTYS